MLRSTLKGCVAKMPPSLDHKEFSQSAIASTRPLCLPQNCLSGVISNQRSLNTARRTLKGYEAMNMIRLGQIKEIKGGDV